MVRKKAERVMVYPSIDRCSSGNLWENQVSNFLSANKGLTAQRFCLILTLTLVAVKLAVLNEA